MILLGFLGCVQTVRFPGDRFAEETGSDTGSPSPVDTDPPGPPATILSTIDDPTISYGCNGAGTAVLAAFRTRGWAGGARVLLVEGAEARVEEHPLVLEESDTAGRWDRYTLGPLADEASPPEPGTSTAIRCGETDALTSWALWTLDRSGAPADCVVWGPAPLDALHALGALNPTIVPLCRDLGTTP